MPYSTYKATVWRSGTFKRHLNEELLRPLLRNICAPWERAFLERVPALLVALVVECTKLVNVMHNKATFGVRSQGQLDGWAKLQHQLRMHTHALKTMSAEVILGISANQRDASRAFEPIILQNMQSVYAS